MQVLWLYWDTLPTAEYTFTRVASAKLGPHMRDPDHLRQNDVSIVNGQFDHISQESIGSVWHSHFYLLRVRAGIHHLLVSGLFCRSLRSSNISVNMYVVDAPWLFSLYWCAGVHSVTSNQIQHLAQIQKPVWQMVGILDTSTRKLASFLLSLILDSAGIQDHVDYCRRLGCGQLCCDFLCSEVSKTGYHCYS